MTRYTRGKPTHQRVADQPTPWNELKATPAKVKTKATISKKDKRPFNKEKDKKNFKPRAKPEPEMSANFTELGSGTKGPPKLKNFMGHRIPEAEATRLKELTSKLKGQGLSRNEQYVAIQGERRRAEKAGKRARDKTCFGCRKFGHYLNECPEGGGAGGPGTSGGGDICFKCGSTEHTSRACKKGGSAYPHATCFICKEVGHISRACPKNTRGIYPGGGACNICDETTHLAKDCPGFGQGVKGKGGVGSDEKLPVMESVSDPYASTEYEPVVANVTKSQPLKKKRKIKF